MPGSNSLSYFVVFSTVWIHCPFDCNALCPIFPKPGFNTSYHIVETVGMLLVQSDLIGLPWLLMLGPEDWSQIPWRQSTWKLLILGLRVDRLLVQANVGPCCVCTCACTKKFLNPKEPPVLTIRMVKNIIAKKLPTFLFLILTIFIVFGSNILVFSESIIYIRRE